MVPLPQGGVRRREARSGEAHHGGLREAQVGQRVLTHTPVWPTYITNGFFSWRFAMPVSCNAARRGKLTAEGIASRVALYDNCGIIEMNSTQNTKKLVSSIYALDEFEQLKWLPG